MPGTLTISTLSDGTNSTSATNCIQGSAKAWVNFNGSTAAIRASYNVSSVTRNGTGDYTVNFANSLVDANYSVSASLSASFGVRGAMCVNLNANPSGWVEVAPTTSTFRIATTDASGSLFDAKYVDLSVFR